MRKLTYSGRNRNKTVPSHVARDRFFGSVAASSEFPPTQWSKMPIPNRKKNAVEITDWGFPLPGPAFGPNSPKRSQSWPLSRLALPGFKNAFEISPKSPGKKITKHMPVQFPPSSNANGHVEAEGEWGSGLNGDGSTGGRKWKGKEKALEPIEDDDGMPMAVSPIKSLLHKPTQVQRPVTPKSEGT